MFAHRNGEVLDEYYEAFFTVHTALAGSFVAMSFILLFSLHDRQCFLPAKMCMNSHVKVKILVAEYRLPILLLFAGIIMNHDTYYFVLPQALYQNNSNDNIASAATAYSPQTNQ